MSASGGIPTGTPGANIAETVITATSGVVANAVAAATLPAAVGKTTYLTGFDCQNGGATTHIDTPVTFVGIATALVYSCPVPTLAANQDGTVSVRFPQPVPATAVNTAITVSMGACGVGNVNAVTNVYGIQL